MIESLYFSRKISTDEKKNSPKLKTLIQSVLVQDEMIVKTPEHLKSFINKTVTEMISTISENTCHEWKIDSRRKVADYV